VLEDRAVPASLSGTVFNDANSGALVGATVTLTTTDSQNHSVSLTQTTDANGAYSFSGVAAGNYTVKVSAPSGYLNGLGANGNLGGTSAVGAVAGISLGANDDGTGYNFGEHATSDGWNAIVSNFNGNAIKAGDSLFFNAVFKVSGLPSGGTTLHVTGQTVSFSANGTMYTVDVPDSNITFSPAATSASTTFDATTNTWTTTLPMSFSGNAFLSAAVFTPPNGLPGGINPVIWQGHFTSDTPGITVNWQWAAAVYSGTSNMGTADYSALGIKPVDSNSLSDYKNSDHAGTAENYRAYVLGGARGGGGSNYTGSYSATGHVVTGAQPVVAATATLNGYVYQYNPDGTLSPVVNQWVTMYDSAGHMYSMQTNDQGFYKFTGVVAGTYTVEADGTTQSTAGTVAGNVIGTAITDTNGGEIVGVSLLGGQDGINYDFYIGQAPS
jgi:hypothetical protein